MKKYISLFIIVFCPSYFFGHQAHSVIRSQLPAGWYPQDKNKLHIRLDQLDLRAQEEYPAELTGIKALIVPHAGYAYSGKVAASCFRLLKKQKNIDRIILLAPSHAVPFRGVAVPDSSTGYAIATGLISFDTKVLKKLVEKYPFILAGTLLNNPFIGEHSIEVECPFLSKYASNVPIIPLLVGYLDEKDIKKVVSVLKKYITPNTIIIVSSDFTHYGERFDYTPFAESTSLASDIKKLDFFVMKNLFTLWEEYQVMLDYFLPLMIWQF